MQTVLSQPDMRTPASRLGLNPRAPEFTGGARALLLRGQGVQPGVITEEERQPGIPTATAQQTAHRRADGIYHLAIAYRRFTSTDNAEDEGHAARLRDVFVQEFGQDYQVAEMRAIMEEDNDPPEEQQDVEDFD